MRNYKLRSHSRSPHFGEYHDIISEKSDCLYLIPVGGVYNELIALIIFKKSSKIALSLEISSKNRILFRYFRYYENIKIALFRRAISLFEPLLIYLSSIYFQKSRSCSRYPQNFVDFIFIQIDQNCAPARNVLKILMIIFKNRAPVLLLEASSKFRRFIF